MKYLLNFALFVLTLCGSTFVNSEGHYEHTATEKLSFSKIHTTVANTRRSVYYGVAKDQLGATWVGSNRGLFKIEDGRIVYDDTVSDLAEDFHVGALAFDHNDTLWVGTSLTLIKYDLRSGVATSLMPEEGRELALPLNEDAMSLLVEGDSVWIGLETALVRFNQKTREFNTWPLRPEQADTAQSASPAQVLARSLLKQGDTVWVGTYTAGLLSVNTQTGRVHAYPSFEEGGSARRVQRVKKIIQSPFDDNHLLLAAAEGLLSFSKDTQIISRFRAQKPISGVVHSLALTKSADLWVGGAELNKISPQGVVTRYDKKADFGIDNDAALIDYIDIDDQGTVSVFFRDIGIYRANASTSPVRFFTRFIDAREESTALYRDSRGDVWLGFDKGLVRGVFRDKRIDYDIVQLSEAKSFGKINKIRESIHGDIYALEDKRLTVFHRDRLEHYDLSDQVGDDTYIQDLVSVSDDTIQLLLYHNGIYNLNKSTRKISPDVTSAHLGLETMIASFHSQSPKSELLFHGFYNIIDFRGQDGQTALAPIVQHYENLTKERKMYLWNQIQLPNNQFYLTHAQSHVTHFDWSCRCLTLIDTPFRRKQIINAISAGQADAPHWFTDRNGDIFYWDQQADRSSTINFRSHVRPQGVVAQSVIGLDGNGALFGTSSGLVWVDPSFSVYGPGLRQPRTIIDNLFINGALAVPGTLLDKQVRYENTVLLKHSQNNLTFVFNSDNTSPHGNIYSRYRLVGLNDEWYIDSGNEAQAVYTNLSHGNYSFEIQSSVDGQTWGDVTRFAVQIKPAMWHTPLAYLLYVLLFFFGVYLFVFYRTRQISARNEELENTVREKTNKIELQLNEIKGHLDFKDRYLVDLNHELKTMLQNQFSEYYDLERFLAKNPGFDSKRILRSNNKMSRLVDQLLVLAILQAGHRLKRKPVDCSKLLRLTIPLFEQFAAEHDVTIVNEVTRSELIIDIDTSTFERIISNLLSNAIKYNRKNGYVKVMAHNDGEKVVIQVADSGDGINVQKLPESFNVQGVDTRVKKTKTSSFPSHGLGLELIAEAIASNKGKVYVTSEKGFGTSFRLEFPLSNSVTADDYELMASTRKMYDLETQDDDIDMEALEVSLENQEGRDSVLIVDDNRVFLETTARQLNASFNILLAQNGKDALALCQQKLPDVVLTDYNMPEMNGFQLLENVKRNPLIGHIPVLVITAAATKDIQLEGLRLGADDFIAKPASPDEIHHKILNKLRLRREIWAKLEDKTESLSTTEQSEPETTDSIEHRVASEWIDKLNTYVSTHCADKEKLTAPSIARHMGVDSRGVTVAIRQMTGSSSLKRYVRDYRLKLAHERLQVEKVGKLAFFAEQYGFTGEEFSRRYKELYGCTPLQTKQKTESNLNL